MRLTATGDPLPGPATPQPGQAAATERRVVSVVFADLVGFTSVAEARDSEAVRDLLGRYFERASEIVARYGGTVEKFIGDAVMAVWGTPVAHEDDAERSVRAALDLVDAVRTLGRDAGIPDLQARAGVLTGEAAVHLGAQNQGMVAGDLVNTASRLQAAAEPGTVLVGDTTRRSAEGAIVFESVGDQALKGKATPVPAHRAIRVVATVGGALRTEALEPPFVGRETEFRLLRDLFHATGRDRRARLVSLTGQAGIGKSRLAWEFEKYLDGITEPVWWHRGRSPAYGDGVTFWALGEMVRKRAGLAESDDEATARLRLTESVAEHIDDSEERAFVEPALLALLGLEEPPAGGRDRLFAGWRMFLERLSETATVAMVFEDLQWADDGLLDFLDHLLEWSRSYPIYVVTLARPDLLERRPTWAAGGRSASSLALDPLGEPAMRELLAGLVPGLPEPAVRTILARADGIPLYAVETVRMLVGDGRLEPAGDGTFRPTGRLAELEVPATLQALIAARLDGLDATDRALLQHASVLGKTFTVEALTAVSGNAVEEVVGRLRSLVARELLELDTDPRSPERGQYGFVQDLIREVAYATLAKRDRRTRHLAAARYFEARGEDELAPVLASHYLDAYRASPDGDGADALRAQARIALRAAADRALSLGSYAGAAAYLEASLGLGVAEPVDEADLLERAGSAATHAGQYERAEALLRRSVDVWRGLGDSSRLGHAIALLALALMSGGHSDRALELLESSLPAFEDDPLSLGRAQVVSRIAHLYIRRGTGAAALQPTDEALAVAERHRALELFVDTLISRAAALSQVGRTLESRVLIEGAQRMASDAGLVAQQLRAAVNEVVLTMEEAPWHAFQRGLQAIEDSRRFGVQPVLVFGAVNTAEVGVRLGEWERCDAIIETALAHEFEPSDRMLFLLIWSALAAYRGVTEDERMREFGVLAATGDIVDQLGRDELDMLRAQLAGDYPAIRRMARRVAQTDTLNAPIYYERSARAALWMGDAAAAREDLAAFDALGRVGAWPMAQRVAIAAGISALEGNRTDAVEGYRSAARSYRELRVEFEGAVMRLDAAMLLGTETPEGAAAADDARAVFERLGARALVEILDRVEADGRSRVRTPASEAGRRTEASRT